MWQVADLSPGGTAAPAPPTEAAIASAFATKLQTVGAITDSMEANMAAALASSSPDDLAEGARVQLIDLSAAHLNKTLGRITGPLNDRGRWPVTLDEPEGKVVAIKTVNLRFVPRLKLNLGFDKEGNITVASTDINPHIRRAGAAAGAAAGAGDAAATTPALPVSRVGLVCG